MSTVQSPRCPSGGRVVAGPGHGGSTAFLGLQCRAARRPADIQRLQGGWVAGGLAGACQGSSLLNRALAEA